MRITEIKIDRTKNLGSYENLKLGVTVALGEDESPVTAIERTKNLIDWELNKEERDARYNNYKAAVESGEANGSTESYKAWMATYEARKAEVESAW